jgi:hypothetical protein
MIKALAAHLARFIILCVKAVGHSFVIIRLGFQLGLPDIMILFLRLGEQRKRYGGKEKQNKKAHTGKSTQHNATGWLSLHFF